MTSQKVNIGRNTMIYGDNLDILADSNCIPSASIDLCYADPPFNSNRSYNVIYKDQRGKDSLSQVIAFEDNWNWTDGVETLYRKMVFEGVASQNVTAILVAMHQFLGPGHLLAYLVGMTARLIHIHRVLKPTGSFYLHCDPTASHYLKLILDAIFGPTNFRNELVWKRSDAHNDSKQGAKHYGRVHDVILFYVKSKDATFNTSYKPLPQTTVDSWYKNIEPGTGRRYNKADVTGPGGAAKGNPLYEWKGITRYWRYKRERMEELDKQGKLIYSKSGMPYEKRYLDESKGVAVQDWWDDISMLRGIKDDGERLGYPTQKPLALLERILEVSSNPGDIILDPFCGCGTAMAAAQKLGRKWIGIDITHLAIVIQKNRLKQMFGIEAKVDYEIIGEPVDLEAAAWLAGYDRYEFQWWATSLIPNAIPAGAGGSSSKTGKKGADRGIDAFINFADDTSGVVKKVIIQVKSGEVSSRDIRDLVGTVQRENACIGVFITLKEATREMKLEALQAGWYQSHNIGKEYRKIQILTIQELLEHKGRVSMPSHDSVLPKAAKIDLNTQVAMNF